MNRRLIIALGLMETEYVEDMEQFKYWSKLRMQVGNVIRGGVVGFCLSQGIYEPHCHMNNCEVPASLLLGQLYPDMSMMDFYVPREFRDAPREFGEKVLDYQKKCKALEDKFVIGISDLWKSTPWGNRFHKQRIDGPGIETLMLGVPAKSGTQIQILDSNINSLFLYIGRQNHSNDLGDELKERCVIAKVIY